MKLVNELGNWLMLTYGIRETLWWALLLGELFHLGVRLKVQNWTHCHSIEYFLLTSLKTVLPKYLDYFYFQNPRNEKSPLDSPLRSSVTEDKTFKGCSFCCLPLSPQSLSFLVLTFWPPFIKLPKLGKSLLLGEPLCKFWHPHTSQVFPVFFSFGILRFINKKWCHASTQPLMYCSKLMHSKQSCGRWKEWHCGCWCITAVVCLICACFGDEVAFFKIFHSLTCCLFCLGLQTGSFT